MKNNPLPRLDTSPELRDRILPFCRVAPGQIWNDPKGLHRIGCLDATDAKTVQELVGTTKPTLAIHDPPYNLIAFSVQDIGSYIEWCSQWVKLTHAVTADNASLYVWLGADQNDGFQPLADFMVLMRGEAFLPRSFITMRNQRGYGTQKNWMAVRQELLYYTKGKPLFNIEAEYTDIPKILRGYYKEINGQITENFERSKSENIRAGNVWVDIQQVFYRLQENVAGCYAQKPLKCIERIVKASSRQGDLITDFFAHSGTTLIVGEMSKRKVFTFDIDPIFVELSIRRLENFRKTGETGWQFANPFPEISDFVIEQKKANEEPESQKNSLAQTSLF